MTAVAAVRIVKAWRQYNVERLPYTWGFDRSDAKKQVVTCDRLTKLLAGGEWRRALDLTWDRDLDLEEVNEWLLELVEVEEDAAESKEARR